MIKTAVDISGPLRVLRAIGEIKDERAVLKRINNYLRARTFEHFRQEKGWPPLAASTVAHKGTLFSGAVGTVEDRNRLRAEASVRAKLGKDLRRAQRRSAAVQGLGGKKAATALVALARRQAVLAEYEDFVGARQQGVQGPATKSLSKTLERLGRAEARAGRKLGRVRASIVSEFDASGLTVESRIPWAGVHNEGGTAGHGANIPARPFLFFEPDDEAQMARIVENYVQEKISGALK